MEMTYLYQKVFYTRPPLYSMCETAYCDTKNVLTW